MDSVLRVAVVYAVMLLIFRVSGKRTLGQSTTFDFMMLLVISETIQAALVGNDSSMTHSFLLVITFVFLNYLLSLWKQRSKLVEKLLEDVPTILVHDGKLLRERMDRARIDEDDILESAREMHGVERLEQIRYAVLERNGKISIITSQ